MLSGVTPEYSYSPFTYLKHFLKGTHIIHILKEQLNLCLNPR